MKSIKEYLQDHHGYLKPAVREDMRNQLSNWSYLHLSFIEDPPIREDLEALMLVEIETRNRPHILRRLYSKWQKMLREEHHEELGI